MNLIDSMFVIDTGRIWKKKTVFRVCISGLSSIMNFRTLPELSASRENLNLELTPPLRFFSLNM